MGLEVHRYIHICGKHSRLREGNERIVRDLGDGGRFVADDVKQWRSSHRNTVVGNAEQVAAPVADVCTRLVDVCKRQGRSTSAHGRALVGQVACVVRHFRISFLVRGLWHRSDADSRERTLFIVVKRQAVKKKGELARDYVLLESGVLSVLCQT